MASICAERGYAETSVEQVVQRAGVPREVFDENFSGTEECGLAVVNQNLADAITVISGSWSADTSEWESILRGAKSLLELRAVHPSFARVVYIDARHSMPPAAFDLYRSGGQVLASMLDRLRADSPEHIRLPPSAARAAVGAAEALVRREITAGRTERLPQLLPSIVYGALVPFLGQEEALRFAELARAQLG